MKPTNFNSASNTPKFYLSKNKKFQKYYVIINHYDPVTKKTKNQYRSLHTGNKQIALNNFNQFVNNYCNSISNENQINKNILLKDFYSEVLEQLKANLNPHTISIYNLSVRKFIELVGNKILRLITNLDIEDFKVKRLQQAVSKYEVNKELVCLKALFNTAIRMNYLTSNPCRFVKKYTIAETKIKVFSENEIELLLANIQDKTLLNIVKFALWSGLRLNEILNLQVSDIDFLNETIDITNKKNFVTKNKRNKVLILNDKLKCLINEILGINNERSNVFDISAGISPDKYLFTAYGRNFPLNKSSISRKFKSELRKLNLSEDLHFHCLRHTYISSLVQKGVPLNFIREIVGHSSITTTMKYITLNKTELTKYANY